MVLWSLNLFSSKIQIILCMNKIDWKKNYAAVMWGHTYTRRRRARDIRRAAERASNAVHAQANESG
jgi:hypothetical protein